MLRVAMVGTGRVSENHREAIEASHGRVELAGVHNRTRRKAAERAELWGVRVYDALEDVLDDPGVDAVMVLTHVDSHIEIAEKAVAAGKHVLVEKPAGPDPAAIRALASQADKNGVVVMPGHNYAYIPEFERMHRLAQRGDLGEIRALFINYVIRHPEEVARDYSGVLEEVMVHHIYLAVALLGIPARVIAGAPPTAWERHPYEDQAWLTMDYGRATAHAFATFAVDDMSNSPWTFVVKLLGTQGSAALEWRTAIFNRALGTLSMALVPYEDSYSNELMAFVDAIEGRRPLISPLEAAAVSAEITEIAQLSRRSGRFEPIPVSHQDAPERTEA